ncbi:laccase-5 [Infundibulicybe gibba]|nr:laccase-5 [Infundibulicybe gibba]
MAIGPSTTLHVANKDIQPDGFTRSAVLVSGQYPAPLIQANKGDNFRVNITNTLDDPSMFRGTSIHWHGVLQHGTNWADGPVGVNQCPISPGHSFTYAFQPRGQAGTFWYHSHFANQYCDGLRGPLVIYDPHDPHKSLYDESTVITLGEWYHIPSPLIVGPAAADSTLINGKGRYVGGELVDLAIINVTKGRRYRFRLVSISCEPNYTFSIDGHQITIIEADGESTRPVTVDALTIFAGQRYSFILTADRPIDNYWIRALPNSGANGLATGFTNGTNSAILRYKGAPESDPTTNQTSDPAILQETQLHPLTDPAAPGAPYLGGVDRALRLELGFNAPVDPCLLQILAGKYKPEDLMPAGSIYRLPRNKTIEVTVPAFALGGPHVFSVVRSAGNDTVPNFVDPVRRDVVSTGAAGSQDVVIRFRTDNPGPWIFHCHIEFHLTAGLAVVFAADLEDVEEANPTPVAWDKLCPIYDALPASVTEVQTASTTV